VGARQTDHGLSHSGWRAVSYSGEGPNCGPNCATVETVNRSPRQRLTGRGHPRLSYTARRQGIRIRIDRHSSGSGRHTEGLDVCTDPNLDTRRTPRLIVRSRQLRALYRASGSASSNDRNTIALPPQPRRATGASVTAPTATASCRSSQPSRVQPCARLAPQPPRKLYPQQPCTLSSSLPSARPSSRAPTRPPQ
jgi:hypothetical protein